jgi:hypothetical protein
MGEIRNLIGVYGHIDRAAVADGERRAAVSQVLPLYRDPEVQWFEEFQAWTRELRPDTPEDEAFPSRDEALEGLAKVEPRGRMRARRMFAIAAAARADPELVHGESAALAAAALRGEGLTEDDGAARGLLELLADQDRLPYVEEQAPGALDEWWAQLLETAAENGLIGDPAGIGPRPCTGRLVMVDLPGGSVPVATLTTAFEIEALEFDRAIAFLAPKNWPACNGFWCQMKELGVQPSGAHRYHEEVSIDCARKDAVWTIQAVLDFRFRRFENPRVAITEYELSKGAPQPDVLVDEGSLVVQQLSPAPASKLRVTTTKRVRFNHAFSGEALALMMCALGYADVVEDLVFTCALGEGEGSPFPDERGAKGATVDPLIQQGATALKACLDDCAEAARASAEKIDEGSYSADALVQDIASMWVRMLREGATSVDLGIRSAQEAAARARPSEPRSS